jgi:hypothetical protein
MWPLVCNNVGQSDKLKMVGRCAVLSGAGKWSDCSPGSITSAALVVRYEYHAENYLGFLQLACLMILLRHL